jgi:hypothetical protein
MSIWNKVVPCDEKHKALQWHFRVHFVEQLCRTFSAPLASGANG